MAKNAKAAPKNFPDQIYVKIEVDGEESYLVADEEIYGVEDGEKVAVYELLRVHTKRVTHELIP